MSVEQEHTRVEMGTRRHGNTNRSNTLIKGATFLFSLVLVFGFVSAASRGVELLAAGTEESAVARNHFGLRQKELASQLFHIFFFYTQKNTLNE